MTFGNKFLHDHKIKLAGATFVVGSVDITLDPCCDAPGCGSPDLSEVFFHASIYVAERRCFVRCIVLFHFPSHLLGSLR